MEKHTPPEAGAPSTRRAASPYLWVTSTHFAEGFPYSVVNTLAEVLFRELGASLQVIGLTSLFHLPWNLKFLWAPFLDGFSTKRAWILGSEVAIGALLVALAFASTAAVVLPLAALLFFLLAFASATHDVAVDGYYLEGLDAAGQSRFVGYRSTAYRVAMLAVSGPLLVLIGEVGWLLGLLAAAAVFALLGTFHALYLPRFERPRRPFAALVRGALGLRVLLVAGFVAGAVLGIREGLGLTAVRHGIERAVRAAPWMKEVSISGWIALGLFVLLAVALAFVGPLKRRMTKSESFYAAAFVDFLAQHQVGRILAFVALFRAGESFLLKMRYPFLREAGMSLADIGWASGTAGVVASFTATLIGGHLIGRHGLRRWIWPFVLGQNLLNLLYAWAAQAGLGAGGLTVVITIECFGAGLGTAVFMIYLMRCCRPDHKAAHMAILTALMSVSFTLAGVLSGFLADWLGFANYFAFTFVATLPAMLLIPFLPHLDRPQAE